MIGALRLGVDRVSGSRVLVHAEGDGGPSASRRIEDHHDHGSADAGAGEHEAVETCGNA